MPIGSKSQVKTGWSSMPDSVPAFGRRFQLTSQLSGFMKVMLFFEIEIEIEIVIENRCQNDVFRTDFDPDGDFDFDFG